MQQQQQQQSYVSYGRVPFNPRSASNVEIPEEDEIDEKAVAQSLTQTSSQNNNDGTKNIVFSINYL